MTVNLERHQEQLEEKQAACLEQIRELENQVTRAGEMVATSSVFLQAASQRMDSSQGSQRVLELFRMGSSARVLACIALPLWRPPREGPLPFIAHHSFLGILSSLSVSLVHCLAEGVGRWLFPTDRCPFLPLSAQFQKEALAEYAARMESLEAEVKESLRTCFPSETDVRSERPRRTSPELREQDLAPAEADVQESRF